MSRFQKRARTAVTPWLLALTFLLAWPIAANAAVGFSFDIRSIEGEDWGGEGIAVATRSDRSGQLSLDVRVARLRLPERQGDVADVHLVCADLVWDTDRWRCDQGRLSAATSPVGAQDAGWSGYWHRDGSLALDISALGVAAGSIDLAIRYDKAGWRADAQLKRLEVAPVLDLLSPGAIPDDWQTRGRLGGQVVLHGQSAMSRAEAQLVVDRLSFSAPDGTQAAENLIVRLDLRASARSTGWSFDAALRWPAGVLYSEPLYVDAKSVPVTLNAEGRYAPGSQRLELDAWTLGFAKAFKVSGAGRFDTADAAILELTVAAQADDAGPVYDLLLQPFLIGSAADDLAVTGSVGAVLHLDEDGVEQAGLTLNGLAMVDRRQRFALHRTDGSVAWQRRSVLSDSRLETKGVTLLGIRSGPFSASGAFVADRVSLSSPVVVPLLGGEVALDRFELTGALVRGKTPRWTASASVRDVSLEELTRELDWPPFSGTLTATLDDMSYADRLFSVGGGLRLSAFDGKIRVDDLRIQDPLGAVPVLGASATLRDLNLEALTRTFQFGLIEGRLDGDVDDLQLVAWQPDRFDLHLYTPDGDRSRRRISQRAVENLTELGSGVPAGLSSSFLSLFEEFSYDAIDVRIALRGDVAEIDGLAREDGGYYLVRGRGLPRIDVIGRNRRVAWRDLVDRLKQIQVEGARIE